MQKLLLLTFLASAAFFTGQAQTGQPLQQDDYRQADDVKPATSKFGIKVGYNVARITGSTPNFSPDSKNGFMAAVFFSPSKNSGLGYRSELVFSRQGFGFDENGKSNSVQSDYIYMPHFTTFTIKNFIQFQVGSQIGYLLKSSKQTEAESSSDDITAFTKRIDYGAAFGLELYPLKGLVLGGRYNMSFGNTYKQMDSSFPMPNPLPFTPADVKGKNAVINLFVGYRL